MSRDADSIESPKELFCSRRLPPDWQASFGTEVTGEGWITSEPRVCRVPTRVNQAARTTSLPSLIKDNTRLRSQSFSSR